MSETKTKKYLQGLRSKFTKPQIFPCFALNIQYDELFRIYCTNSGVNLQDKIIMVSCGSDPYALFPESCQVGSPPDKKFGWYYRDSVYHNPRLDHMDSPLREILAWYSEETSQSEDFYETLIKFPCKLFLRADSPKDDPLSNLLLYQLSYANNLT